MSHHQLADHLRGIARQLDGSPLEERRKIERLADEFDMLLAPGMDGAKWLAKRKKLLSTAQDFTAVLEGRVGKNFKEIAIAMREFAGALHALPAGE